LVLLSGTVGTFDYVRLVVLVHERRDTLLSALEVNGGVCLKPIALIVLVENVVFAVTNL
jgi:hypothetical protein